MAKKPSLDNPSVKAYLPVLPDCLLVSLSPAGVLSLTLNRPEALNAFDDELSMALKMALKFAEKSAEVRAVIITGSGRAFCAGQDLKSRSIQAAEGDVPHLGESIRTRYAPIIKAIAHLEKPVIAAVNGVAAGAGASLAFACDLRLATPEVKFIQAFIQVGLIPDSGACWFLPRLVGMGRAMELMLLGTPLEAQTAHQWGLLNAIHPQENLLAQAEALATRLASGPTKAYGLLKRAMHKAADTDLDDYLEHEAQCQEIAGRSGDYQEGVSAFTQKRPPQFKGA